MHDPIHNSPSEIMQNASAQFSRRMWFVLCIAIALVLLANVPRVMHGIIMHKRIQIVRKIAAMELGAAPSIAEVQQWTTKHGFASFGPSTWQAGTNHGQSLIAERAITTGSLFWRPATTRVFARWNSDGTFQSIEFDLWHFPPGGVAGSAFDEVIPRYSLVLPVVAIVYILLRNSKRWHRRGKKLCVECGYPTGTSPVCTECGAALCRNGGVTE